MATQPAAPRGRSLWRSWNGGPIWRFGSGRLAG
jgi:hypothetical protein